MFSWRANTKEGTNGQTRRRLKRITIAVLENLLYINENAKRSAESILNLYIHFLLSFPVTSGAS